MRTGGKILVDQLRARGTDTLFCVPGESYLDVLNALYDIPEKISTYNARHEAGAANMAEAYGKLTGKPGVALVTRGPGACHAAIGVHIAYQDSTPMILIIGQVAQNMKDREAFQEIDYKSMFASVAKWCAEIDSVERIPEYINRAYNVALSGRKGPVVISIPENVLSKKADIKDPCFSENREAAPQQDVRMSLTDLFNKSSKPLILIGGSGWDKSSSDQILSFAMKYNVPVSTSFRRQDLIHNNSPVYCGSFGTSVSPTLLERIKESDLLLVLGARLGEMTTQGYKTINLDDHKQKLIHVYSDSNEVGKVYLPTLGLTSSIKNISALLVGLEIHTDNRWQSWCKKLRSEHLLDVTPPSYKGILDLGKVFNLLDKELPSNAVVTLDAGNHTGWPQRFLTYSPDRRQIGSTCGAMGYSVPAAVAASLLDRDRLVVCLVGDGGFMMSGMELATAVQYQAPIIVLVFNNNSYGTIRMHQEKKYPGRVIATNLENPSFKELGEAMGVYAEIIFKTSEFLPAFRRCLAKKKPCLLELKTDQKQLSSRFKLSDIMKPGH